jgi:MraZ protein
MGGSDVAQMRFFSSTTKNKIDAKGRVSIPAPFRKVLEREDEPVLVLIPNLFTQAIDGMGFSRLEALHDAIAALPEGEDTEALRDEILGRAHQISLDDTGRIVLPPEMRQHYGLTDEAVFVGRGDTFQIVSPAVHGAKSTSSRDRARGAYTRLDIRPLPAARPAT